MDIKKTMWLLFYSSQTWALKKAEEMRLETFAKEILR